MSTTRPPGRDPMWDLDDEEGWPETTVPAIRPDIPASVGPSPPEYDVDARDTTVDAARTQESTPRRIKSATRRKINRVLKGVVVTAIGGAAILGVRLYRADHAPARQTNPESKQQKKPTQPEQTASAEKLPASITFQIDVKAEYGRLVVVKIQALNISEAVQRQIKYIAFLPDGEASTNSSGELEQKGKLLITTHDGTTTTYTLNTPLTASFDGSDKTIEVTATK